MVFTASALGHVLTISSCDERATTSWCACVNGGASGGYWGDLKEIRAWFFQRAFDAAGRPKRWSDRVALTDAIESVIRQTRKWLAAEPGKYGVPTSALTPEECDTVARYTVPVKIAVLNGKKV